MKQKKHIMDSKSFLKKRWIRSPKETDSDTDSDYETFMTPTSWPILLVMKSASEETPMSKLSPFAIQRGLEEIAGILKSAGRLRVVSQQLHSQQTVLALVAGC